MTLAFAESVARGLEDHPRWLSCTYLYDRHGSEIFEAITRQPEYYQTRTENAILEAHAGDLRRVVGDTTLVELGSGSSTKTRHLLEAWCRAGPTHYVPIDVSVAAVESARRDLLDRFPDITLEGFASTYERALPLAARLTPLTLIFLGSTIGNFNHAELDSFLDMVSGHLSRDDSFLLGIDRVKDIRRLEAAYNDAAGFTAAFVVNIFDRMNRELGCRIPLDAIEHVAYYNDRLERIEIHARFRREVHVEIPLLGRTFRLAAGELVLTEISRKFRPEAVAANLGRFGFALQQVHTDPEELFAVLLFRRRRETPFAEGRRRHLEAMLRRMRRQTLDLVRPIAEIEAAGALPETWSQALAPHLQSVARYENAWLVEALAADPEGLEPPSPATGRGAGERDDTGAPGARLTVVLEQLARVRREALDRLARAPLDPTRSLTSGGLLYRRVCEHEAREQEQLLEAIQRQPEDLLQPLNPGTPPVRPDLFPAESLLIPAGEFVMGAPQAKATTDSEQPEHRLHLAAFRIDAAPVANARFIEFIDADGYRREELWSEAGWSWRTENSIESPGAWRRSEGAWMVGHFGRWSVIDPARPVVHVSWYEASAFARWCDKRLPTEAEWEKAACWDPERAAGRTYPWGEATPSADHANLDRYLWQPTPVGSYPRGRSFYGCHQMLGDVWEWTASHFEPYPGFEPFPDQRHSAHDFGAGFRVLRGGSWATPRDSIRGSTRRWRRPTNRHVFAGLRCASNA